MKGPRITTLEQLHELALAKGSVIREQAYPGERPTPAAWAMNWIAMDLYRAISRGLYVYQKPEKKKSKIQKNFKLPIP